MNFYRCNFYKPRNGEYQKIGFASVQLENILAIEASGDKRWIIVMTNGVEYLIDDEELEKIENNIKLLGGNLL